MTIGTVVQTAILVIMTYRINWDQEVRTTNTWIPFTNYSVREVC